MGVTSKIEICNMAMGHLGNYGTVEDIDTPTSKKEKAFALWYDTTREYALKLLLPNFALSRRLVAQKAMAPAFGYTYAYEYPSDSLKVLGFGDIDAKDLNYNIEVDADGVKEIQYDVDYSTAGLPLRFVKNITDVTKFSPEFTLGLAILLAEKTALQITQDQRKADAFAAKVPGKLSEISGMNAQENPPIRRSESKFKRARYSDPVRNNEKL